MAAPIAIRFTGDTGGLETAIQRASSTVSAGTAKMLDGIKGAAAGMMAADKAAAAAAQSVGQSAVSYDKLAQSAHQYVAAQTLIRQAINETREAEKAGTMDRQAAAAQLLQLRTALSAASAEYRAQANAIQQGAAKVHGSAGMAKFGLQDLGFQLSDVATQFAGGTRAAVIFAQQGPQVVQAIQLMSGGAGKFASFMGGPWGVGIMVGVSVLGALVSKLGESKDEADKTGKAFETLADKLDMTRHSYDEVLAATREYNAEQRKAQQITLDAAAAAAKAAAANIGEALSIRQKLAAQLAQQEMLLKGPGPEGGRAANYGGNYVAQNEQEAAVASLKQRMADNDKQLQDLATGARNAVGQVATEIAKLRTDPQYAIEERFKRLRTEATASIKDVDALTRKLAELNRQEAAAKKALADSTRSATGTSASEQASIGDMTALIKQLFPGARITSTTGGQHVKGSDHYAGRAIDFVPAGGMGQYSKAEVEQMLKDAGVNIRRNQQGVEQFFGPGDKGHSDHFHVAWQGSASPESAQRAAEAAARKQQAAIEKAASDAKQYADLSASLDGQLLQAKRANITDAAQIADIARQQVANDRDKLIADIEAQAVKNPLIAAHKQELEDAVKAAAAQKLITINTQEQARLGEEALKAMRAANDNERDMLQSALSLAHTAAERRDIQLRLLARDREEERAQLQNTVRNSTDAGERQRASDRLGQIDTIYAGRAAVVRQDTQGPLERYIADNDPKLIREKVESFQVAQLESVRQGIDDAIAGALGVKDPFLKSLIDLFIQTNLIQPIAQALQKASAGGGGGGFLGSIFGGIGSAIFGGGAGPVASLMPSVESTFAANAAIFAGGGMVTGPGNGTSDSIHARLSNGEFVMTADAVRRIGASNLDMLNKGSAPKFANGGFVGGMPLPPLARNDNGGTTVHVTLKASGNPKADRESADQIGRELRRHLNGTVRVR